MANTTPGCRYPLALRLLLYAAASAGLTAWLMALAGAEINDESFKEGQLVETVQLILAGLTMGIFGLAAIRQRAYRGVFGLAGGLAGVAAIRELDTVLDQYVPLVGWHGPAWLLVVVLVGVAWHHRRELGASLEAVLGAPAGLLAWTGIVVVVIFAQIAGQADAWKAVMTDSYSREFKRTLEELIEAFGYLQLLFASWEALWVPLAAPRDTADLAAPPTEAAAEQPLAGRVQE